MNYYFRPMTAVADFVHCSLIGHCLVNIFLALKTYLLLFCLSFLQQQDREQTSNCSSVFLFIAFALCHFNKVPLIQKLYFSAVTAFLVWLKCSYTWNEEIWCFFGAVLLNVFWCSNLSLCGSHHAVTCSLCCRPGQCS